MTLSYLSPGVHIRYNRYSAKIIIQEIPISLCVCKLNLHLGCCITHATVSAVLLQEQGCRKKCPAGSDSYTAISCPSYTTFTSSIREISTFAPCLGEQVTQSILSGNGCVPLVSIQTYFPIRCRRSTNSLSIQSEGSHPSVSPSSQDISPLPPKSLYQTSTLPLHVAYRKKSISDYNRRNGQKRPECPYEIPLPASYKISR